MKYFKAIITSDFINSSKRKDFKSQFFIAKYNATKQRPKTEYKIIIDREDKRRVVIIIDESEMQDLLQQLNLLTK